MSLEERINDILLEHGYGDEPDNKLLAAEILTAVKEAGWKSPEEYKKILDDWTEAVQENENYALHYVQLVSCEEARHLACDYLASKGNIIDKYTDEDTVKPQYSVIIAALDEMYGYFTQPLPDGTAFRRVIVPKEEVKP